MFKIFKKFKMKEWLQMLFCLVFVVVQVWLDLSIPGYMSTITQYIQSQGNDITQVLMPGGYMLLCALGSLVCAIIVGYVAANLAAGLTARLRSEFYSKVESFSMEEMNHFSIPSLITRSTNDMTQIQTFIAMGLQVLIKAPILATWAIIIISGKNWHWSVATGIAVFVLALMVISLVVFVLPKIRTVQGLTDNINRITRENLTGVRVVRAYNAEKFQEKKFDDANQVLTSTNLFTSRRMAIMLPGMMFIMNMLSLAIYWIGAYLVDAATMATKGDVFSDMIVFSSYAMQVVMAFVMLVMIFMMLPRCIVSARRINEVLDTELSIVDGQLEKQPHGSGEVEFRDVCFKYPDADDYILRDITFMANPGETVAFIGSTGSGKSTLINLIPRFYDVTSGEILIDGVNVKKYQLSNLYDKIGYVSQKAIIFSGTIESNVAFGTKEQADEAELKEALRVSKGLEFVEKLDNQYQAPTAQSGSNLSGGQKQRLAIARAIYRKPEIFIFDDSFSALDYKTDRELRAALEEESTNTTTFIVAQRIGTIRNADRIIVLDKGKIVGNGRHEELMENCEVYQEIAYSQLSKEELINE